MKCNVSQLFAELNPMLAVGVNGVKTAGITCMTDYPSSSVKYISKLCAGYYGPIYCAELIQPSGISSSSTAPQCVSQIAVKTLSTTASQDMVPSLK
jgi:hypothetical protein